MVQSGCPRRAGAIAEAAQRKLTERTTKLLEQSRHAAVAAVLRNLGRPARASAGTAGGRRFPPLAGCWAKGAVRCVLIPPGCLREPFFGEILPQDRFCWFAAIG